MPRTNNQKANCLLVKLTHGYEAIVDTEDFERVSVFKWYPHDSHGRIYAETNLKLPSGKWTMLALHRFVMNCHTGDGNVVDHKNGNTLDNRRANLRITTGRGNARNRISSPNIKRGGYKGVSWHKATGKWRVTIAAGSVKKNGKSGIIHLGLFTDPEKAARAYDMVARKHFGEFAALNFP